VNEANVVFSFFFGAIGTSVGVLHFCGGVLTVIEPLLKATPSFSSSSLHSFVVLVGIELVIVPWLLVFKFRENFSNTPDFSRNCGNAPGLN